MKTCSRCNQIKSLNGFHKDSRKKLGVRPCCKSCVAMINKKRYADAPEAQKARSLVYYYSNTEACKARRKQWLEKASPDKYKKWHQANKKNRNAYSNAQYQRRKSEGICVRCLSVSRERKVLCRACSNEDTAIKKNKRRSNLQFKLACTLRGRINKAVKRGQKAGSAVRDLGCSVAFFAAHIAETFQSGMSWSNHGEWHLDHIKPLSSFDLTDRTQFLEAAHYTNYQPLWAVDNIRKGGVPSEF